MSVIIYGWALLGIEAGPELATNSSIKTKNLVSHEEEFPSALNINLAEYRSNPDAIGDKTDRQLPKDEIPLGRRTAEMLRFQVWF